MAALCDILILQRLRQLIKRRGTKSLIIVPDGPLQNLPFEALLLREGPPAKFVLDELPPISYAPSLNILMNLVRRAAASPEARSRLLTVGNPDYPQNVAVPPGPRMTGLLRGGFLGIGEPLPLLPASARECEQIAKAFSHNGENVTKLIGQEATIQNVVAAMKNCGTIHIAAHGLVDEHHGNLFGGIALTPPTDATSGAQDDGILSYYEIFGLPLSQCKLAVLSSCQTNVGPDRPLEAGTSLAQAFFVAGTRRVVASHWSVNDASTVELMSTFFKEISRSLTAQRPLDYAAALQRARQRVRNDPRWESPYYWAPFVLLGPSQ